MILKQKKNLIMNLILNNQYFQEKEVLVKLENVLVNQKNLILNMIEIKIKLIHIQKKNIKLILINQKNQIVNNIMNFQKIKMIFIVNEFQKIVLFKKNMQLN